MRLKGLDAIYQRPKTSDPHAEHKVYPYLLRDMTIDKPDHVWRADIIYLPMRKGCLYLVAIMDWASRRVLAWKPSNTMDTDFCIEALDEAMAKFGKPEIFNTDSQFTSPSFTGRLIAACVKVSMDGRGRCMDNIFIERLWRSVKYECVYLHTFETGSEVRAGIGRRVDQYNDRRAHSSLGERTPAEVLEDVRRLQVVA